MRGRPRVAAPTEQMVLFGAAAPDPPPAAPPSAVELREETAAQAAFLAFHAANPRVYELLVRAARDAIAAGRLKLGVRVLWERIRWETELATEGGDFNLNNRPQAQQQTSSSTTDFKLNNNLHSRYARLIMASEPDLAEVFRTRGLRS